MSFGFWLTLETFNDIPLTEVVICQMTSEDTTNVEIDLEKAKKATENLT
jgi:hypothetical protein